MGRTVCQFCGWTSLTDNERHDPSCPETARKAEETMRRVMREVVNDALNQKGCSSLQQEEGRVMTVRTNDLLHCLLTQINEEICHAQISIEQKKRSKKMIEELIEIDEGVEE